jgi:hypothetical protein
VGFSKAMVVPIPEAMVIDIFWTDTFCAPWNMPRNWDIVFSRWSSIQNAVAREVD